MVTATLTIRPAPETCLQCINLIYQYKDQGNKYTDEERMCNATGVLIKGDFRTKRADNCPLEITDDGEGTNLDVANMGDGE